MIALTMFIGFIALVGLVIVLQVLGIFGGHLIYKIEAKIDGDSHNFMDTLDDMKDEFDGGAIVFLVALLGMGCVVALVLIFILFSCYALGSIII